MRLVNQSANIVIQEPGLEGLYKHIERCGRVCYKSEDRITETSARTFVEMLKKNGHLSPLEHGACIVEYADMMDGFTAIRYRDTESIYRGVTNYRTAIEEVAASGTSLNECLTFDFSETEPKNKRVTFHVITARATLDELLRHRTLSASVESTRYCNYSKGKFGGELTIVRPTQWDAMTDKIDGRALLNAWEAMEQTYTSAIAQGLKPQQARAFLPMQIKSEAYLTAFVDDWEDILTKRITPAAHPDARALCEQIREQLKDNGYI